MPEHVNSILSEKQTEIFNAAFGDHAAANTPIASYTTVGIGGPVDMLLVAHNETELGAMIQQCWQLEVPVMVLGNGSNVLVSDKGIRGVCIVNHAKNIKLIEDPHNPGQMTHIFAESGALMGQVARLALANELATFEWAEGIPGTVGGAVIGNAGAFGGETAENFVSAKILICGREIEQFTKAAMDFRYRSSIFKHTDEKFIVLSAIFKLEPGDSESIQQKMMDCRKKRRKKQPTDKSIGSVFKNPENDYAGRLISQLELKGTRIGDAMISYKHANIFVNVGAATAADYRALIELTQEKVLEHYNIHLEPEILFLGEW